MKIEWTDEALEDLERIYQFNASINAQFAEKVVELLVKAPELLLDTPQVGKRLDQYRPRHVRRILPENRFEMRYEVTATTIFIVRLWSTREDR